jgi:hypothetical protein
MHIYIFLSLAFWHIVQSITVFLFFYKHNNTRINNRDK